MNTPWTISAWFSSWRDCVLRTRDVSRLLRSVSKKCFPGERQWKYALSMNVWTVYIHSYHPVKVNVYWHIGNSKLTLCVNDNLMKEMAKEDRSIEWFWGWRNLFSICIFSQKKIRFDHYLVPNCLVELSLLYVDQGRRDEAIRLLHKAK